MQLPLARRWRLWVRGLQAASQDRVAVRLVGLQVLALKRCNQVEGIDPFDRAAHWLIGEECQAARLLTFLCCKVEFQADNL